MTLFAVHNLISLVVLFLQVRNMIERASKKAVTKQELKLPLVRIKVLLLSILSSYFSFFSLRRICSFLILTMVNLATIKQVDYSGFMTLNPQKFGQKYVGKVRQFLFLPPDQKLQIFSKADDSHYLYNTQVANPQDILIFSKAPKKGRGDGKFHDEISCWIPIIT